MIAFCKKALKKKVTNALKNICETLSVIKYCTVGFHKTYDFSFTGSQTNERKRFRNSRANIIIVVYVQHP